MKKYLKDSYLMKEYDYEKNKNFELEKLTLGSDKQVWWKCSNGHEWKSKISGRSKGHGCPYCSGRLTITGVNDLKTLYPEISREWNYDKNNSIPEEYTSHSAKKVFWKCDKGHEW